MTTSKQMKVSSTKHIDRIIQIKPTRLEQPVAIVQSKAPSIALSEFFRAYLQMLNDMNSIGHRKIYELDINQFDVEINAEFRGIANNEINIAL